MPSLSQAKSRSLRVGNGRQALIAQLDRRYVWHPFTQMRDWLKNDPIVIVSAKGANLRDARGRSYLDANSSIWTNLHGHRHPKLDAALRSQLKKIAHSSALGLANEPAALLAQQLVSAANPPPLKRHARLAPARLEKVFYSDDGSTALEVALKLAYETCRRTTGNPQPRFLSLTGAYHGDTVGAVSLGHIDLFHKAYQGLLFRSDQVMAPYCYRCPFNRARPECADARTYRQCRWECVDQVAARLERQHRRGAPYAGLVVEPLMQGAAGMIPQPQGWLGRVAELARANKTPLIMDEVMTGFGRTGPGPGVDQSSNLFACHNEKVQPDYMAVAKGLTGGYLPLAATLVRQSVFDVYLGEYDEFKTFFHGHSYTANQLGCSVALASLKLLQSSRSIQQRQSVQQTLAEQLELLWEHPCVGDIRQVGLIAGIELVRSRVDRAPFHLRERAGIRVCEAMTRRGVITRPIGNILVLMPPYCCTAKQVCTMVTVMREALDEVLPPR
jgi:adenosylmethionine---8-amino-7-oxononanoate aminotransferase